MDFQWDINWHIQTKMSSMKNKNGKNKNKETKNKTKQNKKNTKKQNKTKHTTVLANIFITDVLQFQASQI